jgi:hypothetical protein
MSIQLNCKCGRYFELDDGSAGRSIPCPACDAMVAVPSMSDPSTHAADAYSGVQAAAKAGNNGWGKSQTHGDNDYDYNTTAEERQRPVEIDPRFVRKEPPPAATGGFGGINAGVGGGLLMMVLAVVWFFGALLLVDRIFFYPPILFVLGLIAFFKGLANSTR